VAMEGHVKTLDHGMISCFDKLETVVQNGFRAGFADPHEYNQDRDVQLADHLLMMAARLVLPASNGKDGHRCPESWTRDEKKSRGKPKQATNIIVA
jgi:hypothetical protein